MEDANRPYKVEDLAEAVNNYTQARVTWKEVSNRIESSRKSMESLLAEEGRAAAEMNRFGATVKKMAAKLEK